MEVKIKRLSKLAVIPSYSKPGDAGMDLTATKVVKSFDTFTGEYKHLYVDSDLSIELPKGYVGLLFPRSSIKNTGLSLSNSVGVIDSGYRGSIQAVFNIIDPSLEHYVVGDRFAQLIIIPYPQIEFREVGELSETQRGTGGFGSTNK